MVDQQLHERHEVLVDAAAVLLAQQQRELVLERSLALLLVGQNREDLVGLLLGFDGIRRRRVLLLFGDDGLDFGELQVGTAH